MPKWNITAKCVARELYLVEAETEEEARVNFESGKYVEVEQMEIEDIEIEKIEPYTREETQRKDSDLVWASEQEKVEQRAKETLGVRKGEDHA